MRADLICIHCHKSEVVMIDEKNCWHCVSCGHWYVPFFYPLKKVEENIQVIKDSGERRAFGTGAVRDMSEGKGRNDLLHPGVLLRVFDWFYSDSTIIPRCREMLPRTLRLKEALLKWYAGDTEYDYLALCFCTMCSRIGDKYNDEKFFIVALQRLSKHYENGAKKYGDHNWSLGIPSTSFYDSAMRHLDKSILGMTDEDHESAFLFNLIGLMYNEMYRKDLEVKIYETGRNSQTKIENTGTAKTVPPSIIDASKEDIKKQLLVALEREYKSSPFGRLLCGRISNLLQKMRQKPFYPFRDTRHYYRNPVQTVSGVVQYLFYKKSGLSLGLKRFQEETENLYLQRKEKQVPRQEGTGETFCDEKVPTVLSQECCY